MYETADLITDIEGMITTNLPPIIAIAIILAVVRLVLLWFLSSLKLVNHV